MNDIAIVIVNHNTSSDLRACLQTIARERAAQTIVVDNASTDDSRAMLASDFPWVSVIANAANPGYGAAANQGILASSAPYVLLLNSDTLLHPGTLATITAYFERNPAAAVVGPRLENSDGSLQASCYPLPTPFNLFLEESTVGRCIRYIPLLRERYLRTWQHTRARQVPWVLGAALGIRRAAFERVGGFDESFFMYFEEVDLCTRLVAMGWEIHFTPDARITHIGGASTGQQSARMTRQVFASAAHYYRQHYGPWHSRQLHAVVVAVITARIGRDTALLLWDRQHSRRSALFADVVVCASILRDARRRWSTTL